MGNNESCNELNAEKSLILGYFPIRGKGQVIRLLCEYLKIPYRDLFFTPQCWQEFKKSKKLNWTFQQLPFLKDQDFVVTEVYPICLYLINKAGRKDLLGMKLEDQMKIDLYFFKQEQISVLLTLMVKLRALPYQQKKMEFMQIFNSQIKPKIQHLERTCCQNYYFGYLSILDFFIYETIHTLSYLIPNQLGSIPKLRKIYATILTIPQIHDYEESSRAVKQICPAAFFEKWKQRCCGSSQEQC